MARQQKNTTSNMRFLDLVFIVFYMVLFVCSLLFYIGFNTFNQAFLSLTQGTFPILVGSLIISIISLDDILQTKFPISFKFGFRIALSLQFLWSVYLYLHHIGYLSSSFPVPDVSFFYTNAPIFIWIVRTLFHRIIAIHKAVNTSKK